MRSKQSLPPTGACRPIGPAPGSAARQGSQPGTVTQDGTTWTIRGTGGNINWGGNSALAALTNVSGNATVVAKLVSTLVGSGSAAGAGIVLADSANGAGKTPAVALVVNGFTVNSSGVVTNNGSIELTTEQANGQHNNPLVSVSVGTPYTINTNWNLPSLPDDTYNPSVWLKLVESGSGSSTVFTGYYSMDGANWTLVGATAAGLVSFPDSSNVAGLVSTTLARFTNVSASPLWFGTPPEVNGRAAPAAVTTATCQLSAQGESTAGNSGITYTWSATTVPPGAAPPTFSVNGSSAAQNSTATFYAPGTYIFTAAMADSAGDVAANTVTVVVEQTATSVVVSPSPVNVTAGAEQSFSAALEDQFGAAVPYSAYAWAERQRHARRRRPVHGPGQRARWARPRSR